MLYFWSEKLETSVKNITTSYCVQTFKWYCKCTSKLITIKYFHWLTAFIFSYLFDSSRCLCVFWLSILSNCYLCFAVTLATRGPWAAAAETEGQRGKMAYLRCLSCQRTNVFDYGSELIYVRLWLQMQQQELAQIQQRDANLTALAAIGPRKKRKLDSPSFGTDTEVPNISPSAWQSAALVLISFCPSSWPL